MMSESVQSLRIALEEKGHSPEHFAWFRSADSATFDIIMSFMLGVAAIGTGGAIGAIAVVKKDPLPELHEAQNVPHHVAVAVCGDDVEIWSGNAHHEIEKLIMKYSRGSFRGHLHHYPERIDLTLDDEINGRLVLTEKWIALEHGCLDTARAAVALAWGPAYTKTD
jgi:hypothetical protein